MYTQERAALMGALKARAVLQHTVRTFLDLRSAKGEAAEAAAEARWPQVKGGASDLMPDQQLSKLWTHLPFSYLRECCNGLWWAT